MEIVDWGEVHYQQALDQQLDLVKKVQQKDINETFVFCSHPPVVTLGRATKENDVLGWQGDIVEVSRGGRATYHGPNQQVIYPILNLTNEERRLFRPRDIKSYLNFLESLIVGALNKFDVQAESRTTTTYDSQGSKLEVTGVWVGQQKIASLGIAIKKWVSYHGAAVNLYKDEKAFSGINPCGFSTNTMVSLEELVGSKVERSDFQKAITAQIYQ